MIMLDEAVETLGLVEVFTTEQHDYSWAEFRAWRAPYSGRFYWYADVGCSCTSFGDDFTSFADFSDGGRDALERALRAWHAAHAGDCPEQVVIECIERLRLLPRS